jgi:hypothetical protein
MYMYPKTWFWVCNFTLWQLNLWSLRMWFMVMEFIMGTLQMFEGIWFLVCNFGKHYGDFAPQRQNLVFMTRTSSNQCPKIVM